MAVKINFRNVFVLFYLIFVCVKLEAKSDEKNNISGEIKSTNKMVIFFNLFNCQ